MRRSHIGAASNALGFARNGEGFAPIISEYDQRTLDDGQLITRLRTAYNERVVSEVQRRLKGTLLREQQGKLIKAGSLLKSVLLSLAACGAGGHSIFENLVGGWR